MNLKDTIRLHLDEFKAICTAHNVNTLYAFGSSISDRFDEKDSDIDLIVDVAIADPVNRGEKLLSLWEQFEWFFNRKVDLVTEKSLKNPYLKQSIDGAKELIYDGEREEVFV